jgi:hypothetical protein
MPPRDWRFESAVGAGANLNRKRIRLSRVGEFEDDG